MRRGLVLLLGAAATVLALAGVAQASSPAEREIQSLFWAISFFAVVVAVFVFGVLFWFLYRYRESVSPRRKEHLEGHRNLEIVWTVIPILILVTVSALSYPVLTFTDTMPSPDTTVRVYAERFAWRFEYEDGTSQAGEVWIRQNAVVRFEITSVDVIHSLAIPELGVKIDAVPGRWTMAWAQPEETGDYLVQCAELCGTGHYDMRAVFRVFPESEARLFGPPPVALKFLQVDLRQSGGVGGTWSISPSTVEVTLLQANTWRVVNNNPAPYTFRVDPPVDATVLVPAFGDAWLNFTVSEPSPTPVPYGPTDPAARAQGMVGQLNVLAGEIVTIELWDDGRNLRMIPDPLLLPKDVPVVIRLVNTGTISHNFAMGVPYEEVRWDPFLEPGEEVVVPTPFTFTDDASGLYWCDVPGHRAAGMEARFIVGEGGDEIPSGALPVFEMLGITFAVAVPAMFAYVYRHARRRHG